VNTVSGRLPHQLPRAAEPNLHSDINFPTVQVGWAHFDGIPAHRRIGLCAPSIPLS
jgi:hypothetical protein